MSNTLQGLQKRRDFGQERIKQKKYNEARDDFQYVVSNLYVDNDQKASLKMQCFNQIALCDLELGQYEACKQACSDSFNIYTIMRPEEKNKTPHKNDILNPHYATIFIRLGQIEEKQKNYRQALKFYQQALTIYPKGEAGQFIEACLVNFGIPPIDTEDESLKPYSQIYNCVYSSGNFLSCYQECINKISEHMPDSTEVKKIDDAGVVQMMLGVTSFLLNEAGNENMDTVIDISLTIASLFIQRGAKKAWANSDVIVEAVIQYKDNVKLLGTCLTILDSCPPEKFKAFANLEFIRVLVNALKLEFSADQISDIMKFIFFILNVDTKLIDGLLDTDLLDFAIKTHTKESFLVVRALVPNDEMAKRARENGSIDWTLSMIDENIETPTYLGMCLFILTKIVVVSAKDESFNMESFSQKCFPAVFKIVKSQKDDEMICNAYSLLSQFVKYAKKEITESKILLVSSVLLASHLKNPDFELRILRFIYQCAVDGLNDEMGKVKPLLPTVMKVLDAYPNIKEIVDYTVAIAVIMDHPNKLSLLQSGLLQFPNSQILKNHIDLLKEAMKK